MMSNLFKLSLTRLRRMHILLFILIAAIITGGAFFAISRWQYNSENSSIVRRLSQSADRIGFELRDVPVKPDKIAPDQQMYWKINDTKNELLIALNGAAKAKEVNNAQSFTKNHLLIMQSAEKLNEVIPNGAEEYLQKSSDQIKKDIDFDQFLIKTGQTRVDGKYSMALNSLILRILSFIIFPVIFVILTFLINFLWINTFDTDSKRLLLINTRKRSLLILENILTTFFLLLIFICTTILAIFVLSIFFKNSEVVMLSYPLNSEMSFNLGRQLSNIILTSLPMSILYISLTQLATMTIKNLNIRLVLLVIITGFLALINFGEKFNPFYQSGRLLFDYGYKLDYLMIIPIVILVGILIVINCRIINKRSVG